MAGIEENLTKLFKQHNKAVPALVTTGTVRDVDTAKYTCTVTRIDRPTLYDVRLNAVEYEGSRFVVKPSIGSEVLVCQIESDQAEAYLLAVSKIDELLIKVENTSYLLSANGHAISKADESLKKILNELTDQVLKVYAPKDVPGLTALKQRINDLLK
ncbi:hypothetical protein [Pelobium manganitolerans]|uniref:hypothetical protein n=1 Tax=Pelobium manganitolerans TaxID=1842495 RepID=UPI003FA367CF